MGVRNLYAIDVDSKTDKISAAWVGPDQGTNSTTWGPAKTENAAHDQLGGQLRLAVLPGGQPLRLPRQAPGQHRRRHRGEPRRQRARHGRRRRRRPDRRVLGLHDGQAGSPTTRRTTRASSDIPAPKPTNIWYGPQGGCYDFPRNANGVADLQRHEHEHRRRTRTAVARSLFGGSQAPMTAGTYRKPAGDEGGRVAGLLGRSLVPVGLRGRQQPPPRAADGPGDGVHGRPADRG